jgi:hypothetical protein
MKYNLESVKGNKANAHGVFETPDEILKWSNPKAIAEIYLVQLTNGYWLFGYKWAANQGGGLAGPSLDDTKILTRDMAVYLAIKRLWRSHIYVEALLLTNKAILKEASVEIEKLNTFPRSTNINLITQSGVNMLTYSKVLGGFTWAGHTFYLTPKIVDLKPSKFITCTEASTGLCMAIVETTNIANAYELSRRTIEHETRGNPDVLRIVVESGIKSLALQAQDMYVKLSALKAL